MFEQKCSNSVQPTTFNPTTLIGDQDLGKIRKTVTGALQMLVVVDGEKSVAQRGQGLSHRGTAEGSVSIFCV